MDGRAETPSPGVLSAGAHRHIPYLSFHKSIIREICRPQKDDLLIFAKGLGMRRVSPSTSSTWEYDHHQVRG